MRDKLKERLIKYFEIDRDTYYYILIRDKSAFQYGTMKFDDFKEFDEEIINDLVNYLGDLFEENK